MLSSIGTLRNERINLISIWIQYLIHYWIIIVLSLCTLILEQEFTSLEIASFPLIQPLIYYFFDHRPIHTSSYLYECQYLQSIFRIFGIFKKLINQNSSKKVYWNMKELMKWAANIWPNISYNAYKAAWKILGLNLEKEIDHHKEMLEFEEDFIL